jgi:hypothetical protein
MSKSSLEQRIASALNAAAISTTELDKLIGEAEAAAQAADENATKVRAAALDPALTIDAAKVGAEVAAATLTRDRLRAALPRLRTRYTEARHQEDVAAWKEDTEKLVVTRDAMRMKFAQILPVELILRLVEQLTAMRALDQEIYALNNRRPDDQSLHPLFSATPSFALELKLPDPEKPGQLLWPPPQPSISPAVLAALERDTFVGQFVHDGTYEKLRDKRALEANRRQIAEAERSQKEFEQSRGGS